MDWMFKLLHDVEIQKLELERTIRNTNQLFKPWPSLESSATETDDKPHPAIGIVASTASSTPVLTTEEQQGVDLVNKLLHKAQKARDVQKKLEEPKRARATGKSQPLQQDERLNKTSSNASVDIAETVQSSGVKVGKGSSKGRQSVEVKHHNNSGISKFSVKEPYSTLNNKTKTTKTFDKPQKSGSRTSERPSSSSGQRRVVAAHINAPFQTNPRLTSAKLQTTYRAATKKPLPKIYGSTSGTTGKGRVPSSTFKGSNSAVSTEKNSASSSRSAHSGSSSSSSQDYCTGPNIGLQQLHHGTKENKHVICESVPHSKSIDKCETYHEHVNEMDGNSNCDTGADAVQTKLDKLNVKDHRSSHTDAANRSPREQSCDKPLFQLLKDGASITLPQKLKKLVYGNRKLREKMYTQKVTKKVNSPQTSREFPLQIEHAFGDSEVLQTQLQARQAQHLLNIYSNMCDVLHSLSLDQLSATSSPADVIRAKKLMEYLLSTFHDTEQLLHTSDFSLLQSANTNSVQDIRHKVAGPDLHCSSVWYPSNSSLPGSDKAPAIKYKSYKQLESYMTLVYNLQLLQLQIDVMDKTAAVVLPLLKSLDPISSEFIQVLRSSYSMLSINPNRVPVVVKDTIQDESFCNQEEDKN